MFVSVNKHHSGSAAALTAGAGGLQMHWCMIED